MASENGDGVIGEEVNKASQEIVNKLVSMVQSDPSFMNLLRQTIGKLVNENLAQISERQNRLEEEKERLKGEVHTLHVTVDKLRQTIGELETDRSTLYEQHHSSKLEITELQQYTRRNCILISGIPESKVERDSDGKPIPENTDKLVMDLSKDKLGIELKEEDIDRTHRVSGKRRTDGKSRAIVAKFTRYNIRNKVIKARSELKGTHIGIQDLLCKTKQELLNKSKDMVNQVPRAKAAWSWDGNVYVSINTTSASSSDTKTMRHHIRSFWDIDNLAHLWGAVQ
jgi:hypothetical protein